MRGVVTISDLAIMIAIVDDDLPGGCRTFWILSLPSLNARAAKFLRSERYA